MVRWLTEAGHRFAATADTGGIIVQVTLRDHQADCQSVNQVYSRFVTALTEAADDAVWKGTAAGKRGSVHKCHVDASAAPAVSLTANSRCTQLLKCEPQAP